jgi:hypothetical protein
MIYHPISSLPKSRCIQDPHIVYGSLEFDSENGLTVVLELFAEIQSNALALRVI